MTIIEKLRDEIEQAILEFSQNNQFISFERQQNINHIRTLLTSNNPLKVKANLVQYIETLSRGFLSIFPFLEVNRFKNSLKQVLHSQHYHENVILKSMVEEAGIQLNKDEIINPSSETSILSRLEKLEDALVIQQGEMSVLQQEIKRLKTENQFLTKTISMLTEKNKQLASANQALQDENNKSDYKVRDLKQKYECLTKENAQLKKQLLQYTKSSEDDARKKQKLQVNSDTENDQKSLLTSEKSFLSFLSSKPKIKETCYEEALTEKKYMSRSLRLTRDSYA